MLAKLPFRTKLLLVAILPLVVLIGFAGFTLRDAFTSIDEQNDDAALLVPYRALTLAARAVADEGVASAWFVQTGASDPPASKALMFDTRNVTDEAIKRLEAALAELEGRVRPATLDAVRSVLLQLNADDTARGQVNTRVDPGPVFQGIADSMLAAAGEITRDIQDRELARGLGTVLALDRQQVALAREAALVIGRLAGSSQGDLGEWAQAITEQDAQVRRFFETATPAQTRAFESTDAVAPSTDPVRAGAETIVPAALPQAGEAAPVDYAEWYLERQRQLGDGSSAVLRQVDEDFDARREETRNDALLLAVITALAVILAIALAYAVARSVTRSLRALTRAARDVAERRLPRLVDTLRRGGDLTPDQLEGFAPIRVESRDELGDLAKAFNTVQQVTVAVAEQQAELLKKGIGDLYVNLARRNQSLLDRQISLLDDMEARVEDPDELSSLFELDHLATRMRRNAESLLVLSGAEQPRQWGTAVPVLDVARGAAAEIADFARVTYFGFDDDVAIAGNAVADVSHLLAELLENATAFSPPNTPVVVAGRRVEHRYVITITDEGIGIDDERLAALNNLLTRPPATGLALSRTLGLVVVAHLAARYGIVVQLRRAPGTGITAVVGLPTTVLARVDAPRSGGDAGRPAPMQPTEPTEPTEPADRVVAEPIFREPVATQTVRATRAASEPSTPLIAWRDLHDDDGSARRAPTQPATPVEARPVATPPVDEPPVAPPPVEQPVGPRTTAGLVSRTPGAHLTHTPGGSDPRPAGEVRPRPERVAELLSRHERGKRDGRVSGRAPGNGAGNGDGQGRDATRGDETQEWRP